MLWLSEVLLQNPEVESFEDLKDVITQRAAAGERFFPYGYQASICRHAC